MPNMKLGKKLPSPETCYLRFITACDALRELRNRHDGAAREYKDSLRATDGLMIMPTQGHLGGVASGLAEAIDVLDKALRVNAPSKAPRKPKKR